MVAIVMTLIPFWLETKVKYVLVVAIANFEPRLVYTNHIIMKKSTKKIEVYHQNPKNYINTFFLHQVQKTAST
jgi:hypothetical protein